LHKSAIYLLLHILAVYQAPCAENLQLIAEDLILYHVTGSKDVFKAKNAQYFKKADGDMWMILLQGSHRTSRLANNGDWIKAVPMRDENILYLTDVDECLDRGEETFMQDWEYCEDQEPLDPARRSDFVYSRRIAKLVASLLEDPILTYSRNLPVVEL
ncbi:hypothetical protein LTR66_017789, partial [Elasticomyces elasticus]